MSHRVSFRLIISPSALYHLRTLPSPSMSGIFNLNSSVYIDLSMSTLGKGFSSSGKVVKLTVMSWLSSSFFSLLSLSEVVLNHWLDDCGRTKDSAELDEEMIAVLPRECRSTRFAIYLVAIDVIKIPYSLLLYLYLFWKQLSMQLR